MGRWSGPNGEPHELPGAVLFGLRDDRICEIGVRLAVKQIHDGYSP